MRIGVLEVLTDWAPRGAVANLYGSHFHRHYASVMPQAVSAWCRQLGHEVHYATYYGQAAPERLLPEELDVVFLATYTQAITLAYALAKLYRRRGALTVLGGPHATAFPTDSLRFFDLVVHDCDKRLVERILNGDVEPGTVATSGHVLDDVPSVAERMPEIKIATLRRGRRMLLSNVGMLSSLGCPYRCDFCVDWKNDYVTLPQDRLLEDLRYISEHLPGILLAFHDPNFGVKFDEMLSLMEQIPANRRNPYAMESSLTILRGPRLRRLQETNCVYVAPGVESWTGYSNKSGTGRSLGREKLESVVEHFTELHRYVPGLQANFLFGTDGDEGEEPAELTREFIRRTPFVWPTLNIPIPFGGTPMYDRYLAEGRILTEIPFAFYYTPYLIIRPRHYDPLSYYDQLISLYRAVASNRLLLRRLGSVKRRSVRMLHFFRTAKTHAEVYDLQAMRRRIASDWELRSFLEGHSRKLPRFYHERMKARLGPYMELLSAEDLRPELEPLGAAAARDEPAPRPKLVGIGGR